VQPGKIVLVRAMHAYGGTRGVASLILNLDPEQKFMVNLTLWMPQERILIPTD
jgi:hypothetical protein